MSTPKVTFGFDHKVLLGLAPQSIQSATVNGPTITEPWRTGRQLAVILLGGAFGAGADGAVRLQGLLRSDGTTWETLKESDGTTDLEFTPALLDDGFPGGAEANALMGTLDLNRLDSQTYKAIRVQAQESGAGTMLLGVGLVIGMVYSAPVGQDDDLFAKQQPA